MRRWWLVVALLLSLGINAGIVGVLLMQRIQHRAPPPEPVGMPGPERPPLALIADHLGLTGEQRERFLQIQRNFVEQTMRDRRALEEVRRALRLEVGSPTPDRVRIDELLRQMNALTGQLERAFVGNVLASREVLTDAQEREFLELLPRLRQPQPGMMGGPGAGPGAGRPFRPLLRRLLRGGGEEEPPPPEDRPGPPPGDRRP